jgi:hypothetical protein
MGFRFRRQVRLLPGVRLNLSKSGASVSLGGRGFHYTVGPKGTRTTVGLPGTGLSWTDYKPYAKPPRSAPSISDDQAAPAFQSPLPLQPDEYLTPIQSAAPEHIAAFSTSELAPILNAISSRLPIFPFAIAGFVIVLFLSVSAGSQIFTEALAFFCLVLGVVAIQLDRYRRSVTIVYAPSGIAAEAADPLSRSFAPLSECASAWVVQAEGPTLDWKRHAGATRLNTRKRTAPRLGRPECIRGRASFPCVSFGRQELYFLPDAALFIDRRLVAALHYRDLAISQHPTSFVEEEGTPPDATIVGQTWRFVNKNGGPDRRFNNNRQLPICLYSEIDFHSAGGLNGRLHLSQSTAGDTLAKVLAALAQFPSGDASSNSVTSYRIPKRWPTVVYFLVVAIFGASGIASFTPRTVGSPPADSVQTSSPPPADASPVGPMRLRPAPPQVATESTPLSAPMVIIPSSVAAPSDAPMPLPRLRPNNRD